MKNLLSLAFAAVIMVFAYVSAIAGELAGEFVDKKSGVTIILFGGGDDHIVYCFPRTECIGETVKKTGKTEERSVTFNQGKGNQINFRPNRGGDLRLVHFDKKKKNKQTKLTLKRVQGDFVPIPDVVLFNENWGEKGTRVTIKDGAVNYCYNLVECYDAEAKFIGKRNALVNFPWGEIVVAPYGDGYTILYDGPAGNIRDFFKVAAD